DDVEVPHAHGEVGAGRGELAARFVEGQRANLAVVSFERAGRRPAVVVEKVDQPVAGAGVDRLAVAAVGQTGEALAGGRGDLAARHRLLKRHARHLRRVQLEALRADTCQRAPVRAESHQPGRPALFVVTPVFGLIRVVDDLRILPQLHEAVADADG